MKIKYRPRPHKIRELFDLRFGQVFEFPNQLHVLFVKVEMGSLLRSEGTYGMQLTNGSIHSFAGARAVIVRDDIYVTSDLESA